MSHSQGRKAHIISCNVCDGRVVVCSKATF